MKVHHIIFSVQQMLQDPGAAVCQRAVHRDMETSSTKLMASFNIVTIVECKGGIS